MDAVAVEFLSWGGGLGAGGFILYAIFKVFFSKSKFEVTANNTHAELYRNLSNEISRIRADQESLKKEYDEEINDFLERVQILEANLALLSKKNESMKSKALDVYGWISINADRYDPVVYGELKEKLMDIILTNEEEIMTNG